MEDSHRYHAYPTQEVAEGLEHHLNVHRQLYNHVRWDYQRAPEDDKPSEYDQNNKLPDWKRKWPMFGELHSKAAQATVARFHRSLSNLRKKKEKGYNVGRLKRQSPTEYKEVSFKKETTGEWFVSFGLETNDEHVSEKPGVNTLNASNSVGIDLGILNYIHTSDGKTVDWLDLEDEYERLRREQRKLSRKERGSSNYEKQRGEVAKVTRHIRRKVLDY